MAMTAIASRIEMMTLSALRPYPGNARRHSKKQIRQIADSIARFGFTNPVLVSDDEEIIAGHGRVMAAKELGLDEVPTLKLSHLSAAERRAYVLADNKLALNAGWDTEVLAIELQALIDLDFDVALTGFSLAEIDLTLDHAQEASTTAPDIPADRIPEPPEVAVSKRGDLWCLGRHRLLCGDARSTDDIAVLMGEDRADLIFTDPPYNVPIDGHVGGLGRVKHREFAFAAGEMSREDFTEFLTTTLKNTASMASDGAIAFVCMDWRHMRELLDAGEAAFSELKNLCVWNKTNGGMGTFYRSKHELVFVFKVGDGPHVNSFGLGDTGRYRTNVWDYAGISSVGAKRMEELAMHPTVKPVALVADAIRDCSLRGDIVLDVFGGSGTTLIAAESCGRQARIVEYDPAYCDTILARWQAYTGKQALLEATGTVFEEVAEERRAPLAVPVTRARRVRTGK
ncbi:DNA methylase N-4 [Stappia sp. GBMRC 2046]|uniref:site-specific DNA-methyltransferase (adenine-specific) n=2 Tax=Stappia sediminis TaxID=2692190 RepID=A0A7X3LWP7_9HYPH|nr:DNA methylase N-4 [Stappia sediminis]